MKTGTYIILGLLILFFIMIVGNHFFGILKEGMTSGFWPPQECPSGGWKDENPLANGREFTCTSDNKYNSNDTYCPGLLTNNNGICEGSVGNDPRCDALGWNATENKCQSEVSAATSASAKISEADTADAIFRLCGFDDKCINVLNENCSSDDFTGPDALTKYKECLSNNISKYKKDESPNVNCGPGQVPGDVPGTCSDINAPPPATAPPPSDDADPTDDADPGDDADPTDDSDPGDDADPEPNDKSGKSVYINFSSKISYV